MRVRTRFAIQVVFKLLAKLVHEGDGGHGRSVTQRTESTAQHVLRQITDVVDILGDAAAGVDASERLLQPVGAFAAGNTPSAALMLIKFDRPQSELDHADGLVDHHHAGRT